MKLLNTYDDRDDAEDAAEKLTGEKRLASERDATVVIYNLFGIASWYVQFSGAARIVRTTCRLAGNRY